MKIPSIASIFATSLLSPQPQLRGLPMTLRAPNGVEEYVLASQTLLEQRTEPVQRHPIWQFEAPHLLEPRAYLCAALLALAGVLCSAGGIGGGGVYVCLLMVVGQLSPHDAVPLSKAIVFSGSMVTLVLNMRKHSGPGESLIDFTTCRIVVPGALLGTLLGVFVNQTLPEWCVVFVLATILISLSASISYKAYQQCAEERLAQSLFAKSGGCQEALVLEEEVEEEGDSLQWVDVLGSLALLVTVVFCGVLRTHAEACGRLLMSEVVESPGDACHHPLMLPIHGTLVSWVGTESGLVLTTGMCIGLPILACVLASLWSCRGTLRKGWTVTRTVSFSLAAMVTGVLAGLVGVGGGLIFSPFFLLMGLHPSVAVATSSTCIIFTSSSTTLQYVLIDRVIPSLTVLYGTANLVAAFVGTTLVHYMQEHVGRKSLITGIVAGGVGLSAVLSLVQMVGTMNGK